VRKRLRHRKFSGDFTCVFSDELLENKGKNAGCGTDHCLCPKSKSNDNPEHEWCSLKKQINGSVVHITGTFGFFLSGLVIQDCLKKIASIDSDKKSNESVLDIVS
jgi:tRNA A37 threonylcarbamoyladenosine dehydratase